MKKTISPASQTLPGKSEALTPKPKPLTMADLKKEVDSLHQALVEHTREIVELQEALARKRKPVVSNGKVQIKDKATGKVYPSKNATYQTLLKAGELKELVDKGIFGTDPEHNTFGWYALVKTWPDRFEEVKPQPTEDKEKQ